MAIVIIIGLTGLYLSRRNKGSADSDDEEDEDERGDEDDGAKEGPEEEPDGGKPDEETPSTSEADLITQKENILKALKILDADFERI